MATANDKLIENLENQLERLVEQLKDLEECRSEISAEEFDLMKEETVDQIKEFSETLDRMQRGDTTVNNKLSEMKAAIREAISSSFNTEEMIKLFGNQSLSEFQAKLQQLEEDLRLKKIELSAFTKEKFDILVQLEKDGRQLSPQQTVFLRNVRDSDLNYLEQVED